MTILNAIETDILRGMDEDLTDAEVWSGDEDLREALGDALDELSIVGEYYDRTHAIPLRADVGIYYINVPNATPLIVKRATLLGNDRRLEADTLMGMKEKRGANWMLSRGSPWIYTILGIDILVLFPAPSGDGGIVELDVICAPDHYAYSDGYLSIRGELEQALIHYGKYHLLMRSGGSESKAMKEFDAYIAGLQGHAVYKEHMKKAKVYQQRGNIQ